MVHFLVVFFCVLKIWRKRIAQPVNQLMTEVFVEQPRLHRVEIAESILVRKTNLRGVSWEHWCQTVKYQEFKGAQGGD